MGSHLRLLVLVCVAFLAPATASAQSSDPEAGSPSGSIYELPLDGARSDAAPGGTGGERSSPIRSENGFGSSSRVPGTGDAAGEVADSGGSSAPATAGGGTAGGGASGSGATGDGANGGGGGSGPGGGPTESDVPEGGQSREQGAIVRQAAGRSPSVPRALLLIGLGLLVAAGLAAGVRLANRRG